MNIPQLTCLVLLDTGVLLQRTFIMPVGVRLTHLYVYVPEDGTLGLRLSVFNVNEMWIERGHLPSSSLPVYTLSTT